MDCQPVFKNWSPSTPTNFRICSLKADSQLLETGIQTPHPIFLETKFKKLTFKISF
jgi:hypothetical protein